MINQNVGGGNPGEAGGCCATQERKADWDKVFANNKEWD